MYKWSIKKILFCLQLWYTLTAFCLNNICEQKSKQHINTHIYFSKRKKEHWVVNLDFLFITWRRYTCFRLFHYTNWNGLMPYLFNVLVVSINMLILLITCMSLKYPIPKNSNKITRNLKQSTYFLYDRMILKPLKVTAILLSCRENWYSLPKF